MWEPRPLPIPNPMPTLGGDVSQAARRSAVALIVMIFKSCRGIVVSIQEREFSPQILPRAVESAFIAHVLKASA
jgi:hypothetical protein